MPSRFRRLHRTHGAVKVARPTVDVAQLARSVQAGAEPDAVFLKQIEELVAERPQIGLDKKACLIFFQFETERSQERPPHLHRCEQRLAAVEQDAHLAVAALVGDRTDEARRLAGCLNIHRGALVRTEAVLA